jgi:hypothetical protein
MSDEQLPPQTPEIPESITLEYGAVEIELRVFLNGVEQSDRAAVAILCATLATHFETLFTGEPAVIAHRVSEPKHG